MHPNKKDIIYTSFPKSPLPASNKFFIGLFTEASRTLMGGSKGIHKIENYGQKR